MSTPRRTSTAALEKPAAVFAALGDATRLHVVTRLAEGVPLSIAQLTEGTSLTRQAVTKHLEVLAEAGVVHDFRMGKERLWELRRQRLEQARRALDRVASQWEGALQRLRAAAEKE